MNSLDCKNKTQNTRRLCNQVPVSKFSSFFKLDVPFFPFLCLCILWLEEILAQRVDLNDFPQEFLMQLVTRGVLGEEYINKFRRKKEEECRRKEQEEQEECRRKEQLEVEEYRRKEQEEMEEYRRQEKEDLEQLKEYSRKEQEDLEEYRRKEKEEQEEYLKNEQEKPEELEQYRRKEQEDMAEYRRKELEEQEEYRREEQEEYRRTSGEVSWQVLPPQEQNLSVVSVLSSLGSRSVNLRCFMNFIRYRFVLSDLHSLQQAKILYW